MEYFWNWRRQSLAKVGVCYSGLALLWIGVSIGLKAMEHTGCVFGLTAIIECKVLAVVLVWIGRFWLFPRGRLHPWAKGWCLLGGLLLAGSGVIRVAQQFTGGYLMLAGTDTLLWAFLLTNLLETVAAVYYRCWSMTAPRPAYLREQWGLFWAESLKLGLWLALLLGLLFFYLVSFYRFAVYSYSQMMTVFWIGVELFFYGIAAWRLTGGVRAEIVLLEREIAGYLGWRCEAAAELISQRLPELQYLLLSRNYLVTLKQPVISGWAMVSHLILAGCLLGLPRLIGIVTKL
jgi:hypothetical protein